MMQQMLLGYGGSSGGGGSGGGTIAPLMFGVDNSSNSFLELSGPIFASIIIWETTPLLI